VTRLVVGTLLAGGWLLLLLYASPLVFWLVVGVLLWLGISEYLSMALTLGGEQRFRLPVLLAALLPYLATGMGGGVLLTAALVLGFLLLAAAVVASAETLENPMGLLAKAIFGLVYLGLFPAHLPMLFNLPRGPSWILFLTVVIASSDAGAYYSGTLFGRHKLCPAVSPKKTWEGLAGGLIAALLGVLLLSRLVSFPVALLHLLLLGFILSLVGVLGDLTESVIKRAFRVKDSGRLLPGHGGVLDRVDGLLFAAPTLYYLLILVFPHS